MDSVRERLDVDSDDLPDSKIDSILFLQGIEDDFIDATSETFYEESDASKKRKIIRYLMLKTLIKLVPDYPPIIQEAEFQEGVRYAETKVQERIELFWRMN